VTDVVDSEAPAAIETRELQNQLVMKPVEARKAVQA
jgi:hypothetical protein